MDYAGGDFAAQVRQIYAAIMSSAHQRPHVVMVMAVQETALQSLSEKTCTLGIGWIFLNRGPRDMAAFQAAHPDVLATLVTPDQREVGRTQGQQLLALLPEGGNVIYVQGRASNSSAEARYAGLGDVIASSKLSLATVLDGNWTRADTRRVLGKWLGMMLPARYEFHAIACQNDEMATGAIDVLQELAAELGRDDLLRLPVLGCDGLPGLGQRMVDEGRMAGTVVLPLTSPKAVELVAGWYRDHVIPPAQVLLPPRAYPNQAVMVQRWSGNVA